MNPVWHFVNGVPTGGVLRPSVTLAGDGSASAPSYSFASETDFGFYRSGTRSMHLVGAAGTHQLSFGSSFQLKNDGAIGWSSTGQSNGSPDVSLSRGAADVLQLASGDKFAFGGVTNGVPMLKASGATLHVKFGDDSNFTDLKAATVEATGQGFFSTGVAVPAGGAAAAHLRLSATSGLGVYFGSGAPTVSAAQGSVYIRTDGSSTSTRLYVNTNGTTGWTSVTTAA